uniref:Uncharacterized protein n=1 Tax=Podoviridae sp. ct8Lf7 TaxID=2827723 RepID=A0A8S5S1C0_9CAUD|nr:MAG TPA: hypothetical protein [Podoviridae sp. ct8Lf7]
MNNIRNSRRENQKKKIRRNGQKRKEPLLKV